MSERRRGRGVTLVQGLAGGAVTAAVGLFAFLALFCPERRLAGLIPMALWVRLSCGSSRPCGGGRCSGSRWPSPSPSWC